MQNRWVEETAARHGDDPLSLRVYSSRLLGCEPSLVLHGGGNTSVKATAADPFGTLHDTLYVKGSGWDLATIEPQGFAPVRLDLLRRLAALPSLADSALVRAQRSALLDPGAPDPSVEAVLHAMIPFAYVDHTHADAVVAITNTPNGAEQARAAFGPRLLLVPYVMPGFKLARSVGDLTQSIDWGRFDGLILLGHGIFTWGSTAKASYDAMIRLVTAAEEYLDARGAFHSVRRSECGAEDLVMLARVRREVSAAAGRPMIARLNRSAEACGFAGHEKVDGIAACGPVTPDHIIRTKRVPLIFGNDPTSALRSYGDAYREYFRQHAGADLTMLDPAPRWAVWRDRGAHRVRTDGRRRERRLRHRGAYRRRHPVGRGARRMVCAVRGRSVRRRVLGARAGEAQKGRLEAAARGTGGVRDRRGERDRPRRARELSAQGAAVVGADIRALPDGEDAPAGRHILCDVTDASSVTRAVDETVRQFGGLDIVVSNAGVFPRSARIEEMNESVWQDTLAINLTSHQRVLKASIPYLRHGVEPSVVVIGSKNVPAPDPDRQPIPPARRA